MPSSADWFNIPSTDRATMYHAKRLILAALFVASLTPLALSQSVGTCFTDWSAASIIVKAESLFPVDQLAKLAPSKLNADVVRSALCETQTGFVYKLVVRDKSGVLKSLTVDAKHPFDR